MVGRNECSKQPLRPKFKQPFVQVSLENPVHNIATNCGTRSEDGRISHLFAKLNAVLLESTWFLALHRSHRAAGLGDI